jgi:uncharacterized protein (DUF433 family)
MGEKKSTLSEEEIDEIVTAHADDDSAWEPPITVHPEVLSGVPVFRGTRVPVAALFDNLAAGLTLHEFLDNFPTVSREQAMQVLKEHKRPA